MQISLEGLVIRQRRIGEDDRLITILTAEAGVITVYAKNAGRFKGSMAAATELLAHSRFVLFKHKERYSLDKAEAENIFFALRQDIIKLALASYLAQLCAELIPEGVQESGGALRLLLNTLYLLEKDKRSMWQLKAVFELRLLAMLGYMPDLVACAGCGCFEAEQMFFLPHTGQLLCGGCGGLQQQAVGLSAGVLTAMRHSIYSSPERLFQFSLPQASMRYFAQVSQAYILTRLEHTPSTLTFFEGLLPAEETRAAFA